MYEITSIIPNPPLTIPPPEAMKILISLSPIESRYRSSAVTILHVSELKSSNVDELIEDVYSVL